MAAKPNPVSRRNYPVRVNLLPGKLRRRTPSISMSMSVSAFGVLLVVLVVLLAYALFPFNLLSASASLPNIYCYMADQNTEVDDLESKLTNKEAMLANMRTTLVPHAKDLVSQIGLLKSKIANMETAHESLFAYSLWSDIVEEIDRLTPTGVELTSISQYYSQVIIEGTTDQDILIADYAHALTESTLFREDPPYDPVIEWVYEPQPAATSTPIPEPTPETAGSHAFVITVNLSPVGGGQ